MIPPLLIFGETLIFLVRIAVLAKIRLSTDGFVFARCRIVFLLSFFDLFIGYVGSYDTENGHTTGLELPELVITGEEVSYGNKENNAF